MKRIFGYTSAASVIFALVAPMLVCLPEFTACFPRFTEFYLAVEKTALRLIPDEIEELLAAISDKLT